MRPPGRPTRAATRPTPTSPATTTTATTANPAHVETIASVLRRFGGGAGVIPGVTAGRYDVGMSSCRTIDVGSASTFT
ncbi:hypothetical protein BJF78_29685 [Pseudonocardia sp. CNS-139]|nr:hypothetical protein BJF78_29685 [Pseudonocardia sp. CNS-139]